jgi:ABC-type uncharacterized transport system ATPase component
MSLFRDKAYLVDLSSLLITHSLTQAIRASRRISIGECVQEVSQAKRRIHFAGKEFSPSGIANSDPK